MFDKPPPSDELLERMALIWVRWLRDRVAKDLAENPMRPRYPADTGERITVFHTELVRLLKEARDEERDGLDDPMGPLVLSIDTLTVDYNPDRVLAEAAKLADLPSMLWPIKCHVNIHSRRSVTARYGDHGLYLHHYPLGDGRWVITELTTSLYKSRELDAFLLRIASGEVTGFTIEQPSQER